MAGREMRFRKVGTRRAQSISKVVLAIGWRDGRLGTALQAPSPWTDVRLALGSVAATPDPCRGHGGGARGPRAHPGDRRPRGRDAGRRAPADRRRPLDRRVPPARRGARPPSGHPRGGRLVMTADRPRPDPPGRSRRRLSIDDLDVIAPGAFAAAVAPLFEGARAVPRPAGDGPAVRHARRRCSTPARAIAHAMPLDEQIELIDAHPRLGAPPADVSALSFVEQGYGDEATAPETAATAAEAARRDARGGAGPAERRVRGPVRVPLLRLRRRPVARRAAARDARGPRGRPGGRAPPGPRCGRRHRPRPVCHADGHGHGCPRGGIGVIELGANRYGKAAIRLVRVVRGAGRRPGARPDGRHRARG